MPLQKRTTTLSTFYNGSNSQRRTSNFKSMISERLQNFSKNNKFEGSGPTNYRVQHLSQLR